MNPVAPCKAPHLSIPLSVTCWVAILWLQLGLIGCTRMFRPPMEDPQARQMVEALNQSNGDLKQFKALAQVRFESQQEVQSISMALAAVVPDRMRVELLSMMGQPITSLVADGETITIRSHDKEALYRLRQSATALERLIHIPMGIEQLQGILIGRPALPEFVAVQLVEQTAQGMVVALKSRGYAIRARLGFDLQTHKIEMMEVYGEAGGLRFRVNWRQWQQVGPYNVPGKVVVKSASGHQVTVSLKRFWPDVAMSAATFELDDPIQEQ
jgi:outer membrane biogenesis lipoprotein LolB